MNLEKFLTKTKHAVLTQPCFRKFTESALSVQMNGCVQDSGVFDLMEEHHV